MVSPVPKHLRTEREFSNVPARLRDHRNGLIVDRRNGLKIPGAGRHRAKFAPGLSTELIKFALGGSIGDPMAGTGMLAYETGHKCALNDLNQVFSDFLDPLTRWGCKVSYGPASEISWRRDVCIFSPPYYPRTDRKRPCAHNDAKRGPVVGFRDSYDCDHPQFIGNPGGVDAIATYRKQMRGVFDHLGSVCDRMVVVTKNWMRLGVELRLDLDMILTAGEVGWHCVERHGFIPTPSLWSRFNSDRGARQGRCGMIQVEDVLIFERAVTLQQREP